MDYVDDRNACSGADIGVADQASRSAPASTSSDGSLAGLRQLGARTEPPVDAQRFFHPLYRGFAKVLQQIHPGMCIQPQALRFVLDMLMGLLHRLVHTAGGLAASNNSPVTSREVQRAISIVCTPELARHSVSEMTKALTKYLNSTENESTRPNNSVSPPRPNMSKTCGLELPVEWLHRAVTCSLGGRTLSQGSAVGLAAVIEYMSAEILELSGNRCKTTSRIILVEHIETAILEDEELAATFDRQHDVIWPGRCRGAPSALPQKQRSRQLDWWGAALQSYGGHDPLFGEFAGHSEESFVHDNDEHYIEASSGLHSSSEPPRSSWGRPPSPRWPEPDLDGSFLYIMGAANEDIGALAGKDSSCQVLAPQVEGEELEHQRSLLAGEAILHRCDGRVVVPAHEEVLQQYLHGPDLAVSQSSGTDATASTAPGVVAAVPQDIDAQIAAAHAAGLGDDEMVAVVEEGDEGEAVHEDMLQAAIAQVPALPSVSTVVSEQDADDSLRHFLIRKLACAFPHVADATDIGQHDLRASAQLQGDPRMDTLVDAELAIALLTAHRSGGTPVVPRTRSLTAGPRIPIGYLIRTLEDAHIQSADEDSVGDLGQALHAERGDAAADAGPAVQPAVVMPVALPSSHLEPTSTQAALAALLRPAQELHAMAGMIVDDILKIVQPAAVPPSALTALAVLPSPQSGPTPPIQRDWHAWLHPDSMSFAVEELQAVSTPLGNMDTLQWTADIVDLLFAPCAEQIRTMLVQDGSAKGRHAGKAQAFEQAMALPRGHVGAVLDRYNALVSSFETFRTSHAEAEAHSRESALHERALGQAWTTAPSVDIPEDWVSEFIGVWKDFDHMLPLLHVYHQLLRSDIFPKPWPAATGLPADNIGSIAWLNALISRAVEGLTKASHLSVLPLHTFGPVLADLSASLRAMELAHESASSASAASAAGSAAVPGEQLPTLAEDSRLLGALPAGPLRSAALEARAVYARHCKHSLVPYFLDSGKKHLQLRALLWLEMESEIEARAAAAGLDIGSSAIPCLASSSEGWTTADADALCALLHPCTAPPMPPYTPAAPFHDFAALCEQTMKELKGGNGLEITADALQALRVAAESHIVDLFERAQSLVGGAGDKRCLTHEDMRTAKRFKPADRET